MLFQRRGSKQDYSFIISVLESALPTSILTIIEHIYLIFHCQAAHISSDLHPVAYEAPHSSPLWDTFAFLPTTHLSQRSCPWPAFMPSGSVSIEVSSCLRYKTLDNKKHCFPHMGIRAHFLPWQIPDLSLERTCDFT